MSVKRQATTDLNHENWDQDDPSEHEEMGSFKAASKDVLEKRVIRTAKRRTQATGDDSKKSVFSAFGGFNKAAPSSFDFLANLTNGNKTTNGSPASKSDTKGHTFLMGGKHPDYCMPASSSTSKPTFGMTSSPSSIFGGTMTAGQSFTASKGDSTVTDSPFKIQATSSSIDTKQSDTTLKTTNINSNPLSSQVSSTILGLSSGNNNKSLFTVSNNTSIPMKIQPVSSASTVKINFGTAKSNPSDTEKKTEDKSDEIKLKYYSKLKGLNESVLDWIKKHVEETPLCILTPIFKDYEKHLKEIQDEYNSLKEEESKKSNENREIKSNLSETKGTTSNISLGNSVFSNTSTPNSQTSVFGNLNAKENGQKPSGFSFGVNKTTTDSSSSTSTVNTGGFSFGVKTPNTVTTSSPLSTNTALNPNGSAPFSFGTGKPFTFSPNVEVQKPAERTNDANEDEDEPPKVEFTPVVEENSVFDKRCKIFIKKDGNFADKGVGTLYIKKIDDGGKYQLLVRANTNLGNVLLNLILTSSIPTQRLGKNNVMMVCIPTPDAKPPPTPILIRVKTSEEADELLEILNKHKA